jgi:lysophospholipase L1-like esterase
MKKLLRSAGFVTLLAAAASAATPTSPDAGAPATTPATRPATRPLGSAGPVASPAKAVVQAVVNRFEKEIAAYEAADRKNKPTPGGVLFYGSSSVRLWKTLSEDYAGMPVLNRGFGGSTTADALLYVERVVLPCRPATIVFYEGDNDLQKGRTPEQILSDYQAFAKMVHAALPETKILFVSVKPSPKRLELLPIQRKVNELTSAWIETAKDPRLSFVDVFTPMLDPSGKPRGELFGPDRLHMNRNGYKLWTSVIALKPTLGAVKPTMATVKAAAGVAAAAVAPATAGPAVVTQKADPAPAASDLRRSDRWSLRWRG